MLGFACCRGRQPQKNRLEDDGQQVDKIGDKPPESDQVDQTRSQASTSVTVAPETPDEVTRRKMIEVIFNYLESADVGKVVLHGKHGVGKTWIAKEVTKQASSKESFDVIIWVYNRKIEYSSVFYQIAIQQNIVRADYYLSDDGANYDLIVKSLRDELTGRKVLLVLDNDDDNPKAVEEHRLLENTLIKADKSSKVLITTPNINNVMMTCNDNTMQTKAVEIKPLTLSESKDLLIRNWKIDDIQKPCEDDLEDIVRRCKYLPAAIVFTGNMLFYALKNASHDYYIEVAIGEAKKELDDFWMIGCSSGFEKFRNNATILKCLWLSVTYLQGHRSMNYNKLILFWMLDGCFDNTTSLDKAYAEGHKVLIDFINAGLLGGREAGDIVLERTGLNFAQYLFGITCERFRLQKFCNFYDLSISGNVKRMNSSMGIFTKSSKGINFENISLVTLLLKGNDGVSKADQIKLEDQYVTRSIRILFASLVKPILSLQQMCPFISVLILKDCPSISYDNISDIANLTHLMVLEISRCGLREIPEDFVANFELLESLNLSDNPFKIFPRLSFGLSNLRSLFLRRCRELESFPDVNGLRELRLLDLFESKFNSSNNQVCCLEELPALKVLDLSGTNKCPDLGKLDSLNILLLNNCQNLKKLGLLTSLTKLEVVEASYSIELDNLGELNVNSFISKLDFSYTKLSELPPMRNASNLVYLCLKGCSQLQELPPIEGAIKLRILDVSDAVQLEKINASFEEMRSLQELILSNTKIKTLPSLYGLENLRKLMLNGCKALQKLPELDFLTNLLLLDLRDCTALESVSKEQFSHVRVLLLSYERRL